MNLSSATPLTGALRFTETMAGTWRRVGEGFDRPMRFAVAAAVDTPLRPLRTMVGSLRGTFTAEGLAADTAATGSIEVSPVEHRRIRYTLDFLGGDACRYRFDGWKSIDWLRPLSTWTVLPGTIYNQQQTVVGTATLRFALRGTPALLASMRRHPSLARDVLERRRWEGSPGRLEIWYDTFTDPETGDGFWLHHELVAPAGSDPAYVHGWAAVFPADAVPTCERFGPVPVDDTPWFSARSVRATPGARSGQAGSIAWDLAYDDRSEPLFTFPALLWRRRLLPSAQVVVSPSATFRGTIRVAERLFRLDGARGASARIYGNAHAGKWAWLHADLGGGDVLEVVAAVSRHRPLDRLRPLPFIQLRIDGRDWPGSSILAAPRFRCEPSLPRWTVAGRFGDRRLRVAVTQPDDRCVSIEYTDPDGALALCTNTERADAHVVVERKVAGQWRLERQWLLAGTAHAEIGTRG